MFKEIERKYLIESPPGNYKDFPSFKIEQYYLSPKKVTLRLRKISSNKDKYYFTFKYGNGVKRTEIEPRIPVFLYILLVKMFAVSRILKIRYKISYHDNVIELDIYKNIIPKLITAEIEFKSLKEYEDFKPPKWFGKDVSKEAKYKNKWLAKKIK